MRQHEDHIDNYLSPIKETKIILKQKVEYVPPDSSSGNTSSMNEEKYDDSQESQLQQKQKHYNSNLKSSQFHWTDNNLEPDYLQKIKHKKMKSEKQNYEYYLKYCQLDVMGREMKEQMNQLEEEKAQLDFKIQALQEVQNPESKKIGYKLKVRGQAGFTMKESIAETDMKDSALNPNLQDSSNNNGQPFDPNKNSTHNFYNTNFRNSKVIIVQSNNNTNLPSCYQNRILPVFSHTNNSSKNNNSNDISSSDSDQSNNPDIDADISSNQSSDDKQRIKRIPKFRCPVKTCLKEYYLKASQQHHTNLYHPESS